MEMNLYFFVISYDLGVSWLEPMLAEDAKEHIPIKSLNRVGFVVAAEHTCCLRGRLLNSLRESARQ